MAERFGSLEACVDALIERVGKRLVVGLPLGLGKPVALANALYARAKADSGISLTICTALSLEIPEARSELERRFLEPFAARHFRDVPELDYARDRRRGMLPANVRVLEFYFTPGSLLGHAQAQQDYISSNYTHAARDILDRGINVLLQMVCEADGRYSLSCNPDLTLDIVPPMRARGTPCAIVGMLNRQLPFLGNDAAVGEDFFDLLVDAPEGHAPLFAVPNPLAGPVAHAVGLRASTLIRDGGTLQVGIGDLGDAFAHALRLRHTDNARYRKVLAALEAGCGGAERVAREGGLDAFSAGLYGASEMFTNGLLKLYQAGVLSRRIYEDVEVQRRANAGEAIAEGEAEAHVIHGAFYLGPADFYQTLRDMPPAERRLINMTAVSKINQLYGDEELERLQRRHARFVNICMKVTLSGAAASDTVAGGQVVSGVGGQYNFVAMAHALQDARSILLLRSTRTDGRGRTESNIVPEYPQCTIPRHLRDIVVTEYGIAELRGRSDAECADRLIRIADSRFQDELIEAAQRAGKLPRGYRLPPECRHNTPERLRAALRPWCRDGSLPAFPLGTDFTPEEQRLAEALTALKAASGGWRGKLRVLAGALLRGAAGGRHRAELRRMGLDRPRGPAQRLYRRMVAYALKLSET